MHIFLLSLYIISLFIFGWMIIHRLFDVFPTALTIIGAWLMGTVIGVSVTYLFSCLFVKTSDPIVWGVSLTIILGFVMSYVLSDKKKKGKKFSFYIDADIFFLFFAFIFSTWMMIKTFHGGVHGELYVGSNNVFDFSHALGIIRSFSWGMNIPFSSPFQSGLPFFYHFFFYYYVAIWEHLGVPIVSAMNIPSILSMTALLTVIYFLPQLLFKKKPFVGWIAVLLSITNSTLTFWQLLIQKGISISTFKSLWRLPTYPFAGPFDGSTISLFMTLNNYVNQRHLAIAIAFGLFLFMGIEMNIRQKRMQIWNSVLFGVLTGLMFYWNLFIAILVGFLICLTMMMRRQWKQTMIYGLTSCFVVGVSFIPFFPTMRNMLWFMILGGTSGTVVQSWTFPQYLWQNVGVLPLFICIGWFAIVKQKRVVVLPIIILFIMECMYAGIAHHGFDQKFFSFLIIVVDIIAAIGIGWIWEKKQTVLKIVAASCLFVLMVSGIVDFIPIKNEFAFPLVDTSILPAIRWIQKETPRDAVFISYRDMLDPVVFAGRKNFYGFFGNIVQPDRTPFVQAICFGDVTQTNIQHVSYVLVSNKKQNKGGCAIDTITNNPHMTPVYTDDTIRIFRLIQ